MPNGPDHPWRRAAGRFRADVIPAGTVLLNVVSGDAVSMENCHSKPAATPTWKLIGEHAAVRENVTGNVHVSRETALFPLSGSTGDHALLQPAVGVPG